MVRWLDPRLLVVALFRLLVSRLFGRYADRRERQQGRDESFVYAAGDAGDFWLDYVADLGDGWDSTASVAALLARPAVQVGDRSLPHGRVLVMGGDQVYPWAAHAHYRERLEAPYYALLPWSDSDRDLYALPGNHDWYDGLASFAGLFMQQRWFAGWRTRQSRSYFVLRLPQDWWFIAVDVQLDNDIDKPQLDYLLQATRELRDGDRVIIASAAPGWLPDSPALLARNLAFLERTLVAERGGRVQLRLAGDWHHYRRELAADGAHCVVSGGGGAFLHGTVGLRNDPATPARAWPSPGRSRLLLWRLLLFPFLNPGFSLLLGTVLALLLWSVDAVSHGLLFHAAAQSGHWLAPALQLFGALTLSPWVPLSLLAWCVALVAFVEAPPRNRLHRWRAFVGTAHALAHLWLALVLLAWVAPSRLSDPLAFLGAMGLLALLQGLASGLLFGLYLFLAQQLFAAHAGSAWAACRIAGYRHFLRLHIGADGVLQVYVLGLARVCRRWRRRDPAGPKEARVEALDSLQVQLVDHFSVGAARGRH